MKDELKSIRDEALEELKTVESLDELEQLRVKYFGRKGKLTSLLKGMGKLPPEERPIVGKLANEVREVLTSEIDKITEELKRKQLDASLIAESVDITLPGRRPRIGHKHPITQTLERMKEIFVGMGFQVIEGPEIETEYYNFDALNIPEHHPARDMQDTFFVTDSIVLRTHTSPMQVRVMEKQKPPVRVIVPGKVYRRDADISHSPMFHQLEGLLVDEHVTFSELKGVLLSFARQMFGEDVSLRFRPGFFPYTEPSAEVDISCIFCGGKGCRTCSQKGWIEILGAGSVDPNVFGFVDYDPEKYTGFAFGLGIDRTAMLRHGINDIRLLFENDMRFLEQF